ncbi:MAG TPA: mechanosensitive ion channel, partial [Bacteroidales bacterium]|nr:mechanosensitive ion channel [Bacteroidales bacterium]
MEEFLNSNSFKWILSIVIVIAGWLIGILINRFIYKKIKNISQKTHRRYYYLIVKKIKNLITLLLVLIATYIAVNIAPISTDVLKYENNILKILLIITITLLISRLLSNYVQYLLKKSNKLTSKTSIFSVIIDILIYTIGIIVILHTLGISVKAIVASLGIGGLAVALALQETLTNLFAGIQLMLSKKIQIGDYIRLDSGE